MPRLAHGMERCVFFVFGTNYKDGSPRGPGGTGFFIFRESENVPLTFHIYAVTNRHVATDFPNIRINSSETSVQVWEYDPSDWVLSGTDDLAALDVTDQIEFSEDRGIPDQRPIDFVSERAFVSEKFRHDHHVGVGDETVMLGLLSQHDGGKVNLPVARFGNIAAVPNSLTPVQLSRPDRFVRPVKDGCWIPCSMSPTWLRIRPARTASPACVRAAPCRAVRKIDPKARATCTRSTALTCAPGHRCARSADPIHRRHNVAAPSRRPCRYQPPGD
jgi:hypothetical protein